MNYEKHSEINSPYLSAFLEELYVNIKNLSRLDKDIIHLNIWNSDKGIHMSFTTDKSMSNFEHQTFEYDTYHTLAYDVANKCARALCIAYTSMSDEGPVKEWTDIKDVNLELNTRQLDTDDEDANTIHSVLWYDYK